MRYKLVFQFALILLIITKVYSSELEFKMILDGIFRQQEKMAKEITDAIFDAKYSYSETKPSGKIVKNIVALRKVYMEEFEKQKHEFNALTINNRRQNPSEMKKKLTEWRRQEQMIEKTKMPFTPQLRKYYEYSFLGTDSYNGEEVWMIGFQPKRKRAGYVQGFAYISTHDSNVVKLSFLPVRIPFVLRNFGISIDYSQQNDYWLPAKFKMDADVVVKLILTLYQRHIHIEEEYSNYKFNTALPDSIFE